MTSMRAESRHVPTGTVLLTGATLTVIGGVIGLAGAAITAVAAVVAVRRRVEQMETPPTELARRHWRRARTAVHAGTDAWRDGHLSEPIRMG
ncbi:hypothetical protein [Krasilnikovia sp. MM14-A1004]|uniref:hypothetical protein n=1 Tax=Krasilnikovia sp. MM14-A1004 TaxID=3373541 RepID=UPI00399C4C09